MIATAQTSTTAIIFGFVSICMRTADIVIIYNSL